MWLGEICLKNNIYNNHYRNDFLNMVVVGISFLAIHDGVKNIECCFLKRFSVSELLLKERSVIRSGSAKLKIKC